MGRRKRDEEDLSADQKRRTRDRRGTKSSSRAERGRRGRDDGPSERGGIQQQMRGNRQIVAVAYCCVAVLFCMLGYLVKFMAVDSQEIINHPSNQRQELLAERVVRGEIRSADGKVLARTVTDSKGRETRTYPYGRVFCHVVGRTENGNTGIELSQSFPMLTSHTNPLKKLANEFRGEKNPGDHVITTLDASLQQTAYNALGHHKGAVVALEPSTGKILAMVSKPDYDPGTVSSDWERLVEDSSEESALLNRATQGLYPPGSTFKLLTALEYMRENKKYGQYHYNCQGSEIFEGRRIRCYGGERHGALDLQSSLAHSCNGSFARIGMDLDLKSFRALCGRFGINRSIGVKFEYNKSKFVLKEGDGTADITQTAIGQGKTSITPLQNAMISAVIANDGQQMIPYLVDHIENDQGDIVRQYEPKNGEKVIGKKMANRLTRMMKAVVTDGTASSLKYLPWPVAGKTGTAEIDEEGTSHAWFVGFAPAAKPRIVVSVVVEGAGTGSQYAVPIAKSMLEDYLGK